MSNSANQMNGSTKLPAGTAAVHEELFVINLCASMTPMPSVPKHLKGLERYKLYQVSRVEDGRHRYRLRLGFFNSETDAELVLSSVRGLYPAAFAGCATHEDMRYTGDSHAGRHTTSAVKETASQASTVTVSAQASIVHKPVITQSAVSAPKQMVLPTVTAAAPKPDKPIAKVVQHPPMEPAVDEMSFEFMPTPEPGVPAEAMLSNAAATPATDSKPFHVARGITLPKVDLEFAPESLATAAKKASPAVTTTPPSARVNPPNFTPHKAPVASVPSVPAPPAKVTAPAKPAPIVATRMPAPQVTVNKPVAPMAVATPPIPNRAPRIVDDYVPILDTTLTIRTLTVAEIEDSEKPKWFVVQLALSEHPFNLDAMPRLDIFAAYRLYSVVINEGSAVKHALRLGFFREEVSAHAVSGYLQTFFPSPVITRIGIAEYDRFVEPRTVVPTASDSNVVKLGEKRELGNASAPGAGSAVSASRPTFGVTPAPVIPKPRTNDHASNGHTHGQPGAHRGTGGKAPMAAVRKGGNKSLTDDSAIRHVPLQRPQSFFSRLIGRELD